MAQSMPKQQPSEASQMWMYIVQPGGAQKGPISTAVLCRLIEKGIAGLSEKTLVWQAGMATWLPVTQQSPFKEIVEFHRMQWYYCIESGGSAHKGPISSRLLLHKLQEGEIDGMTLVYCANKVNSNSSSGSSDSSSSSNGWVRINENSLLKAQVQKIAAEEEAKEQAFAAASEQQQVFVDDSQQPAMLPQQTKEKGAKTRAFTADDGKQYRWDDCEDQWIETDTIEEDVATIGKVVSATAEAIDDRRRKRALDESDDESDEDNIEAATTTNATADDSNTKTATSDSKPKRKRSKRKSKRGPNTWIYVSGLPADVNFEEIKDHFSKVGLIAISPYDQQPRIKIYRDPEEPQRCKGDCSICYNAAESAQLAVDILHDGYIRPNSKISVSKADFSNATISNDPGNNSSSNSKQQRSALSQAQIKVARSAMRQALAWNEDDDSGVNKASALRIVVLEGLFSPEDFSSDEQFERELEEDLASECTSKCGPLEKMTIFSSNPRGIVVLKFVTSFAARECVQLMNGRFFGGRRISCCFWDGVSNYSISSLLPLTAEAEELAEKEEEARLDDFGDWLEKEQEQLPDEFQLRSE